MAEINPKYREINAQNIIAINLAKKINPNACLVEVPILNNPLPLGNCYWNSEYYSIQNKGKIKFGWLMLLWSGVCVEAVHHAIYESQNGTLVDVTTHPLGKKAKKSLFLPDSSIVIDLNKTPCIHNHFSTLNSKVKFEEFKNLYSQKLLLIKEMSEKLWLSGYQCEHQRLIAQGDGREVILSTKTNNCIQLMTPLISKKDEIDALLGKQIKKLNKNS